MALLDRFFGPDDQFLSPVARIGHDRRFARMDMPDPLPQFGGAAIGTRIAHHRGNAYRRQFIESFELLPAADRVGGISEIEAVWRHYPPSGRDRLGRTHALLPVVYFVRLCRARRASVRPIWSRCNKAVQAALMGLGSLLELGAAAKITDRLLRTFRIGLIMFDKDRWEAIKVFFEALRIPIAVIIAITLLIFPTLLTSFISRAGFRVDQIELAGIKLEAQKSSADLEVTAAQLKQLTAAVSDRDKLLQDLAGQVSPEAKARIDALIQSGKADIKEAQKTADAATQQATAAQTTLQMLSPTVPSGDVPGSSLLVFGADRDAAAAIDEIRHAQTVLANTGAVLALFRKGSFYRSVAVFSSDEARKQAMGPLDSALKRSGQPVSLFSWCAGARRAGSAASSDGTITVPIYQC